MTHTISYGWANGVDGTIDLHAPFPSAEAAAADVRAHYALTPDTEVDVWIGIVRPVRSWEFGCPALCEVVSAMGRSVYPQSVTAVAARDRRTAITLRPDATQAEAERDLHWRIRKWAERWLQVQGWWLVDPQKITVGGD